LPKETGVISLVVNASCDRVTKLPSPGKKIAVTYLYSVENPAISMLDGCSRFGLFFALAK
jgi:hypothetical protein